MNKTVGSNGKLLFGYSADVPKVVEGTDPAEDQPIGGLSTAGKRAKALPDISTLGGASDDPSFTKVVDRRWYERNKHIYPASMWHDFDPEKDYQKDVRRDLGGNTFFY
jgi:protein FAM50